MDHMEKNEVLNGIHCDVENCIYNNGNCCCTADGIHVKHDGFNDNETMCETFCET